MATAGKILKNKEPVTQADKQGVYVTNQIRANFQVGDFVIVDTADGTKHVGFYAGIINYPQLTLMIASSYINFNTDWDKKYFDHLHVIPIWSILNFKAAPAKQE